MARASLPWLAMILVSGLTLAALPKAASSGQGSAADQLSPIHSLPDDSNAERQLFNLANQARARVGVPALQEDSGLTQAARAHAEAMANQQQLSHQLPGEPSLEQRLAAASSLHFDSAGENVSYSTSVDEAQNALMHSPPHRENLLNPGYNVAGFGVVRREAVLYVVQDFAHSIPTIAAGQSANLVVQGVANMRREANLPLLQPVENRDAQAAACTMAHNDSLAGMALPGRYTLRYTTMQASTVPSSVTKAIDDRSVHQLAVGTCYARTASYPNGAYWVVLVLN
jgi:uncharacterized protein YkwD